MRVHRALRQSYFVPTSTKDCPVKLEIIQPTRRTVSRYDFGRVTSPVTDERASGPKKVTPFKGETRFFIQEDQNSPFKGLPEEAKGEIDFQEDKMLREIQLPKDP